MKLQEHLELESRARQARHAQQIRRAVAQCRSLHRQICKAENENRWDDAGALDCDMDKAQRELIRLFHAPTSTTGGMGILGMLAAAGINPFWTNHAVRPSGEPHVVVTLARMAHRPSQPADSFTGEQR